MNQLHWLPSHTTGKLVAAWKNRVVVLTIALLSITFPIFLATGYTALYWAWIRGNLTAALPYLPWARSFGMLAMLGATAALATLFSSDTFPISPKRRLWLSLLATATIGFYSEFRNEGKFHFKNNVHFFAPGTWIHDALNHVFPLGDFLYRVEYSHWNDFLMGPAIVSVLFALVFAKIYAASRNQGPVSLTASTSDEPTDLDHALRFARTLMNVGLFWFFIQAWAEKAGYWRNPHSADELDLPFEFAGTMLGFWIARILTRPFDQRSEKFRSTFLIDFVSSGVIGLLYTLIVGPLTESVASAVAHSLYPVVPSSVDVHHYTPFERHLRPLELLLLAAVMWFALNRSSRGQQFTQLSTTDEQPEAASKWELLATKFGSFYERLQNDSRWNVPLTTLKAFAVTVGFLLLLAIMLSVLQPEGLGWTLATAVAGLGTGIASLLFVNRASRKSFTSVFGRNERPFSD